MKNILITGGFGNLGSWLSEYFATNGYKVFILSKNQRKLETTFEYEFIQCDLSQKEDCINKLKPFSFDYVIHAGSVNDGFVTDYPKLAIDVNAWGTRNLLEAIKDKNVKNFIYLSTFQVYGKYSGTISEDTELTPKHDYGTSHLFGEIFIKQFHQTNNIPYTIIRLTNSYGCPKDYNSSKWYLILNDLAKTAFNSGQIILKSNGKAPRDFIWMGDVCNVFEKIINKEASNNVYNLSGEQTLNMIDIANYVMEAYAEYFGKDATLQINTDDKTEHPTDLLVESQKIKHYIGDFNSPPQFKEEAIKIFEFLKNQTQ